MDLTTLYYIIPAIFVLLLVFPVFVEVRASFNPLYNRGVIALFVMKKKILYYIFSFHGKYIELQNENETQRQELQFDSPQFAVMEEFGKQIKDKIRLKKLYVFYNIGTGDAYTSALLCGFLNQFLTQFFLFLKSRKPTASLCVYDTVSYNKETCEVAGIVQISISFFDVVYSYIYSTILTKKN
ncbi:MAG: hypothetical protein ACI4R8_04805 [Candidatus Caccovivens sp.]